MVLDYSHRSSVPEAYGRLLVCFPGLLMGRILFIDSRKEAHPRRESETGACLVCR